MAKASSSKVQEALSRVIWKLAAEGRIYIADETIEEAYSVYILELDSDVWNCKRNCRNYLGEEYEGKRAFYVGITKKTKQERFEEHITSRVLHQLKESGQITKAQAKVNFWQLGSKITRHHDVRWAGEIEPLAPDGDSLDGRLEDQDHAKLLEQVVIPTALRALGFAVYAGTTEEFVATKMHP
jgi:hypothetical protein